MKSQQATDLKEARLADLTGHTIAIVCDFEAATLHGPGVLERRMIFATNSVAEARERRAELAGLNPVMYRRVDTEAGWKRTA